MAAAFAHAVRVFHLLLILLVVVQPIVGLLLPGGESEMMPWPAARQWNLLLRTTALSAAASALAVLWACPVAAGLSLLGRRGGWWLLAPLLVPPYVHAYAWSFVVAPEGIVGHALGVCGLATWTFGEARTVWVWSCWLWPIPTLLMLAGWRYGARQNVELALLDATPARAWLRAGVPALLPFVGAGALCCFVLALTNYSVPHLCNVNVFATDLLAAQEIGQGVRAIALASWPVTVIGLAATGLCVLALARLGIWTESGSHPPTGRLLHSWRPAVALVGGLLLVVAITLIVPLVSLIGQLRRPAALTECFIGFAEAWRTTVVVLLASAAAGWLIGAATLQQARRAGRVDLRAGLVLGIWTLLAAVPASVWGSAMIRTCNVTVLTQWLYDNGAVAVLVLALAARYAWLAAWAGWVTGKRLDPGLDEQAHLDGATAAQRWSHVHLPNAAGPLAVAALIVAALALTELPLSNMLSPPGWQTLSVRTVNLMHYQRDDQVVAVSLWLLLLPAVASYVACCVNRRCL